MLAKQIIGVSGGFRRVMRRPTLKIRGAAGSSVVVGKVWVERRQVWVVIGSAGVIRASAGVVGGSAGVVREPAGVERCTVVVICCTFSNLTIWGDKGVFTARDFLQNTVS